MRVALRSENYETLVVPKISGKRDTVRGSSRLRHSQARGSEHHDIFLGTYLRQNMEIYYLRHLFPFRGG